MCSKPPTPLVNEWEWHNEDNEDLSEDEVVGQYEWGYK